MCCDRLVGGIAMYKDIELDESALLKKVVKVQNMRKYLFKFFMLSSVG
ncbi:hypothetical protein GCM10011607_04770 [Shewanella inventionis]|uniref:Uncharacterized protein n=1 Tax=Shewanella inventionis TaxID=1738770 RepID=A0ABQ1INX2_9GAMM|nr:hypothetical protein GCM10011607_04770 [Shewanella inventionis]